jgi:hypothetical protein
VPLDNPWDDLDSPADSSTPKADINTRDGKLLVTDPGSGGRGFNVVEVPISTPIAVDFGWIMVGNEQFQPRYRSHFAPLGAPAPQLPAGEIWSPSTRIQVWINGYGGLRVLRIRGRIHLGRFKTLFQLYGYRPEAQLGKIPVYRYNGFEDISTDYGIYKGILLELVDHTDRDEDFFGPRLTPAPSPILTSGPRAPMLPPASAVEQPPEPPAPSPSAVSQTPTPPAVPPMPQPERSPFSAFHPIAETPTPPAPSPAPIPQSPVPAAGKKPGAKKPY